MPQGAITQIGQCRIQAVEPFVGCLGGDAMRLVNQNWWFTTLMVSQAQVLPAARRRTSNAMSPSSGAGFAGVSAAAQFLRKGLKVVLIDKNIVGGSSSGRSAGFLTPDSELELHQLCRRYGNQAAREIWDAPLQGYRGHRQCDQGARHPVWPAGTGLAVPRLGKGGYEAAESELHCRKDVGFDDQKLYDAEQLKSILGSEGYTAGIRYGGTYGINPLQCLQGFKDVLVDNGMQVFESTAMKRLEDHTDLHPRRQHHRRPHHHRRRQARAAHQSAVGRGASTRRPF